MSVGGSFDAYAKSALHEQLFGKGAAPQFEFQTIFENQVEPHNRDFAIEAGKYIFDCYVLTGAFEELLAMLEKSKEPPRFEFEVRGDDQWSADRRQARLPIRPRMQRPCDPRLEGQGILLEVWRQPVEELPPMS